MTGKDLTKTHVVALLLKEMAAKERDVAIFRERFLNGRLLSKGEVEDWIKKKAKGDGPATVWLDVPLPSKFKFQINRKTGAIFTKPPFTISKKNHVSEVHRKLLSYGVAEDRWERSEPTTEGGVLERLRQISVRLAKRYGWQEAQATLFVLTGLIPLVSPVRCNVNLSRITLDVDPSVTSRQLADYYRRIRRNVLAKRTRALSPKHLHLATFLAECDPSTKWEERLNDWNGTYQHWAYDDVFIFTRDCRQAQKRLLSPKISMSNLLASNTEKRKKGEKSPPA